MMALPNQNLNQENTTLRGDRVKSVYSDPQKRTVGLDQRNQTFAQTPQFCSPLLFSQGS